MKKKIVALLLTSVMSIATFSACTAKTQSAISIASLATVSASDVDIWGAVNTEKILQDVSKSDYMAFVQDAKVELTMAKGEYEGAQIIMTPTKDVDAYTVSVGAITGTTTGTTFPADSDHIEVLLQKYIYVGKIYDDSRNPRTGWYPDALLPFATAVEYKENKIKAGNNQGLYFSFQTPIDLPADTYTGSITIDFGSFQKQIPVSIEVLDIEVSEEPHCKSIYLDRWQYFSGELQSGLEMYTAYNNALIKYRLAPDRIKHNLSIDEYVEYCLQFLRNPRCSNVGVDYVTTTREYKGETVTTVKIPELTEEIVCYAQKSFRDGKDYVAKLAMYLGIVDEPQYSGIYNQVECVCTDVRTAFENAAKAIENDTSITSPLKAEVVASIRKVKAVVTSPYYAPVKDYVETWCPQFQWYDDAHRSDYNSQEEKWWYGCISPRAPYPTYHTEDIWLSNRIMGWMQNKYNVVGNLFWAVNIYAAYDGEQYNNIEDYYGTACRFPNVNGDGYLFYPGGQYGLDEPVGSIRLVAARDGFEEYELLYALKEKYAEINQETGNNFKTTSVMNSLTSSLFTGTQITATSEDFAAARSELLQLSACANSGAGFAITGYSDNGTGVIAYDIFLKDGYQLKKNGQNVTSGVKAQGGFKYYVQIDLTKETSGLHLSFECNGKTYKYDKALGGTVTVTDATSFKSGFAKDTVTPTVSEVAGSTAGVSKKIVKVDLPKTTNASQRFALSSNLIKSFNPINSIKAIFRIYYSGSATTMTIYVKYKNVDTLISHQTGINLESGKINNVTMDLATLNAGREVESIRFQVGTTKKEAAKTLYFVDLVYYAK